MCWDWTSKNCFYYSALIAKSGFTTDFSEQQVGLVGTTIKQVSWDPSDSKLKSSLIWELQKNPCRF